MGFGLIFVLSGLACFLVFQPKSRWQRAKGSGKQATTKKSSAKAQQSDLARTIRQLASLMAAGRLGPGLWAAMEEVLLTEMGAHQVSVNSGDGRGGQQMEGPGIGGSNSFPSSRKTSNNHDNHAIVRGDRPASLVIVSTVRQATLLGIPTAQAIYLVCGQGLAKSFETAFTPQLAYAGPAPLRLAGSRRKEWFEATTVWRELAACFEICERSGAPLVAVVNRLADRLDSDSDTEAMRATALAGPKATVKLLTWLPFLGLGLGMVMGVDPISVLLGGPLGWACLVTGLGLVAVGKWWAGRLLAGAARVGEHERRGRRQPAGEPTGVFGRFRV